MTKNNDWVWRSAGALDIPASGDVVIHEPKERWLRAFEGRSRAFYEAVLAHYFAVRGSYSRTARMHPSTALALAPAERMAPVWWPIYEVRRHYVPARIILTDDPPLFLER